MKESHRALPLLAVMIILTGNASLLLFGVFLLVGPLGWIDLDLDASRILLFDTMLSLAFFAQHSLMVRQGFRRRLARWVSPSYHGVIYGVSSAIVLIGVVLLWQPSATILVVFGNPVGWGFRALFVIGAAGMTWGYGSLKGFDPLGVKPLLRYLRNQRKQEAPFIVSGPYRYVRHPLYLFSLLMIWSCPAWTADRLLLNLLWSAWIVVGAIFEEKDLTARFGESYSRYQRAVPMLLPTGRIFKAK